MFVVGETGWANSTFDLLARLRVREGNLWGDRSWGSVGGGYAVDDVGVGPSLCYNVGLHVGMMGWEVVETSGCTPMIGGVNCSVWGSGPVEGWKLGVVGG